MGYTHRPHPAPHHTPRPTHTALSRSAPRALREIKRGSAFLALSAGGGDETGLTRYNLACLSMRHNVKNEVRSLKIVTRNNLASQGTASRAHDNEGCAGVRRAREQCTIPQWRTSTWLASSAQHAAAHAHTPRPAQATTAPPARRGQRAQRPSRPDYCGPCLFCIILLMTKTLLSRKRPAQLATQLASPSRACCPGRDALLKQMSVSLRWRDHRLWFSVSMKACSSLTCPSDGSCSMSAGSERRRTRRPRKSDWLEGSDQAQKGGSREEAYAILGGRRAMCPAHHLLHLDLGLRGLGLLVGLGRSTGR